MLSYIYHHLCERVNGSLAGAVGSVVFQCNERRLWIGLEKEKETIIFKGVKGLVIFLKQKSFDYKCFVWTEVVIFRYV